MEDKDVKTNITLESNKNLIFVTGKNPEEALTKAVNEYLKRVSKEHSPEKCQLCGAKNIDRINFLRPYGENGIWICPSCGNNDVTATKIRILNLHSVIIDKIMENSTWIDPDKCPKL